jgi:allantoicase
VAVKADSHNLFLIRDTDEIYSHLRVTIIPDGGIVRYVFGLHLTYETSTNSFI